MRFTCAILSFTVSLFTLGSGTVAHADLIAYWNFNGLVIGTPSPPGGGAPTSISADTGTGTIDLTSWTGLVDNFGGTTLNNVGGAPAGVSLSMVNQTGNGSFIDFNVDLTGFKDPVLTFATRGTAAGYNSGLWSWSNNGIDFNAVGGNTATTGAAFLLMTVDLTGIAGVTGQSNVTFRYTLNGASAPNGNNRIDNFQINAAQVPEPGTLGMAGLVLVGCLLRRRRS